MGSGGGLFFRSTRRGRAYNYIFSPSDSDSDDSDSDSPGSVSSGCLSAIGSIVLIIIMIAVIFGRINSYVRPGSQSDYRGMKYTSAESKLRSLGFSDVSSIYEWISAKDYKLDGTVKEVHINGKDNISGKFKKGSHVVVYYYKLPENPPVDTPYDSGNSFIGWKPYDAANKLIEQGFAFADIQKECDLDNYNDGTRGKVSKVLINGESEWVCDGVRKKYHRNDSVVVYYHEAKPDAQASAPEGNYTFLLGKDYDVVIDVFKNAGFTNITAKGNDKYSSNSADLDVVTNITIDGETEWSYGIFGSLRKSYKRNVPVIITYNSRK